MRTETVFSDDRLNRYLLRKEWDSKKPRATIIMTNPSAADLLTLDYTTLYILNNFFIAKGLGFGYQEILNMPVKILHWYVERLIRHIEDENKALKSAQKGR